MRLRTLGGLELDGAAFGRPKPLLLLAYLSLEGPRERRFLSELFWPGAARPMNSLRVALSQLRSGAPGVLESDGARLAAAVDGDATRLLERFERGEARRALELYRGPFLAGFHLPGLGAELEEWIYATREFLAGKVRGALVGLAEEDAALGDFAAAARRAEAALDLPGAPPPEPEELARLHRLLVAGGSGRTDDLREEMREVGLPFRLERGAARAQLARGEADAPPAPAALPVPPTSFVGRDPELLELARLLSDDGTRLVTITGAGGTGKSRLALQAARQEVRGARFRDGVFWVPLEAIAEPGRVPAAVAGAIGRALPGRGAPVAELADALGDERLLLVLDNCEHLPESAELVSRLLAACPRLGVLATSRERLGVAGEQVFPLDGLPVAAGASGADATYQDAVRLFVQRARRARLAFDPGPDELPHVLEVCRLVQGSPLGIELAAAWVRMLSSAEIAAELRGSLDLLQASTRGAPDRHRSLRATFEHSWRLLTPVEREALARLSVFVGGFTRQAASRVAGATIPLLASLADKSLLRVTGEGRYDRHPLVYAYTREKLAERPEVEAEARTAHAAFFARLAAEVGARPAGADEAARLERLEREHDNLRAALGWALGPGREGRAGAETGLRLAADLYRFWYYRSHFVEGGAWLQAALDAAADLGPEVDPLRARALHGAGVLALERGDDRRAEALLGRRLELARALGDDAGRAASLNSLGVIAWGRGDLGRARALIEESLAVRRGLGRPELLFGPLANLGLVALADGDLDGAQALLEESLALSVELGHAMGRATALLNLGAVAVDRGDPDGARALFGEAAERFRELGDRDGIAHALEGLAAVAALQGRFALAARLGGAADGLRDAAGAALEPADAERRDRRLAPARAGVGEAAFAAAWAEGRALPPDEAVALALERTAAAPRAERGE